MESNGEVMESNKDSPKTHAIFIYLFLVEGLVYSLGPIMPYVYPQLPSYSLMTLFYAGFYPWCLKFVFTPFLEKYTDFQYGKRKTWIIASSIVLIGLLIFASCYTDLQHAHIFAWTLIAVNIWSVIHSISVQGLGIKYWKDKDKLGVVQTTAQYIGIALGKLLFLKMVNFEFAQMLGLDQPITDASTMVRIYAILVFLSIFIIHFLIKEEQLANQDQAVESKICTIICYNKIFFDVSSKYSRIVIFVLFYGQGFNILNAGLQYNLIQAGFSRNTFNTYDSIISIVLLVSCFLLEDFKFQNKAKWFNCFMAVSVSKMIIVYWFFPTDRWGVVGLLILEIGYNWRRVIKNQIIYSLPLRGASGMLIIGLSSISWLGQSYSLHSIIIDHFSFFPCLACAIVYQIIVMFSIPSFMSWIEQGNQQIDLKLLEKKQIFELEED